MKIFRSFYYFSLLFVLLSAAAFVAPVSAQKMDGIERGRMKSMLKTLKGAIKNDYYDPTFHGIDLDARWKKAEERLEQVETTGQALGVIAQVLMDFDDSHLYFLPPATNLDVEYGFRSQMYGDKCFVTIVKPKSGAQTAGLKQGDQIVSIEGFRPNRKDLWKMDYYFNILSKRAGLKLSVLSPGDAAPHDVELKSELRRLANVINYQNLFEIVNESGKIDVDFNYVKYVGDITIWKMPTFSMDPAAVGTMMSKVKGGSLILDLRGNGGGYVVTLERLAGFIFDKDLEIAQLKGRKEMKPQRSKTQGNNVFKGKLIVLVDHESGSASEIFARLVQLEKRGIVIGDVSAGAVMQSRGWYSTVGANDEVSYGASITHADVIMSDGKSLEHVGVIPDHLLLLTGADLANLRDPVLAKAIELAGGSVSADEAGKYFRYKWRENAKDQDVIEIEVK